MRPATVVAACVSLALLSGCEGSPKPSPPPASQDALTTTTATPTPDGDEVEATTEAAPTTEAPADAGPPEMPAEAKEQTEAGAEAFALHYIDYLDWAYRYGDPAELSSLSLRDCKSCANLEDGVSVDGPIDGDYLHVDRIDPPLVGDGEARIPMTVTQLRGPGSGTSDIVMRLRHTEDRWQVLEITIVE